VLDQKSELLALGVIAIQGSLYAKSLQEKRKQLLFLMV
jgi:hypothetical protein